MNKLLLFLKIEKMRKIISYLLVNKKKGSGKSQQMQIGSEKSWLKTSK